MRGGESTSNLKICNILARSLRFAQDYDQWGGYHPIVESENALHHWTNFASYKLATFLGTSLHCVQTCTRRGLLWGQ